MLIGWRRKEARRSLNVEFRSLRERYLKLCSTLYLLYPPLPPPLSLMFIRNSRCESESMAAEYNLGTLDLAR